LCCEHDFFTAGFSDFAVSSFYGVLSSGSAFFYCRLYVCALILPFISPEKASKILLQLLSN